MRWNRIVCLLTAAMLLLHGCGDASAVGQSGAQQSSGAAGVSGSPSGMEGEAAGAAGGDDAARDENFVPYQAPAFAEAVFHEDMAEGDDNAKIDLSGISDGYVAVRADSEVRLKFQVIKGDGSYDYDLTSGEPSVFPIQSGDGSYTFRVLESVAEGKYAVLYTTDAEVTLKSEFEPFLRPSDYVNYRMDSACVKKAAELAAGEEDVPGVVAAVYDYICSSVTYDREKAATVKSGYLPDPDETLASGKGICFDYAALAAAMLRSQGIPVKMIFGYVSPDDLYHAWNMFYTEETGWVTVDYQVSGDSWNRLDLTFAANGKDSEFIGDGGNYADLYCY
ncbi:MAG: transglutaminase domain-containing protein [Roseburia sp.]|jgi:hypothetical protein|nr:transglutaminase domain-containing protein [Roseburia sp.]